MTTIDANPLTEALQSLVDARLDTIDRMLLGRVNRQDRLAIVREVETQIFDQLPGRDGENLDRDDVLAVLARLDPPEAYLPEEGTNTIPVATRRASTGPIDRTSPQVFDRLSLASGILGMVSEAILLLGSLVAFLGVTEEFVLFASIGVAFLTSLVAVVFAAMRQVRGPWAIIGLVNGLVALLGVLIMAVFLWRS